MRRAVAAAVFVAALAGASEARASGGLVTSPQGASSIAEAQIAIASASGRTARWARLRVKGSAGAFVWVLPVRPGAMLDLASDAWIESLEAATAPRVVPPSFAAPCAVKGGVDVTARVDHVTTRAPSDVAVVADDAALRATLAEWGFTAPSDLAANASAVLASGSRLALLLFSATSSDTTTRAVRVIDDAPPELPLALTSGARGAAITAFVIGDAPATLGPLPPLALDPSSILWRADGTSTWRDARTAALAATPNAWLAESSGATPLFDPRTIPGAAIPAVADTYFARAGAYGDATADALSCTVSAHGASSSSQPVAAACPLGALARVAGPGGLPTCVETTTLPQLSPDAFRCGAGADDLAHAFALRAPVGAWVTRAAGLIPAGVFGQDVVVAPSGDGARDALVRASKYDVTCSTSPGGGVPVSGGSGGGMPPAPSDPGAGAVVSPDDPAVSDTPSSTAGDACSGFASDGCGGDSSSSSSSSSDSCGSSSGSSESSSGGGCGGSSSSSDSSSGCGSSSSGSSSNDCATSGRPQRSPFSRLAIGGLALVALLRRASRERRIRRV